MAAANQVHQHEQEVTMAVANQVHRHEEEATTGAANQVHRHEQGATTGAANSRRTTKSRIQRERRVLSAGKSLGHVATSQGWDVQNVRW